MDTMPYACNQHEYGQVQAQEKARACRAQGLHLKAPMPCRVRLRASTAAGDTGAPVNRAVARPSAASMELFPLLQPELGPCID